MIEMKHDTPGNAPRPAGDASVMARLDAGAVRELNALYALLGEIMDGLWFVKVEETLGFDQALDIDEAVWKIFGKIEARRLKEFLDKNWHLIFADENCLDGVHFDSKIVESPARLLSRLEKLLALSTFNNTLEYTFAREGDASLVMTIRKCRVHEGMVKMDRTPSQIRSVCSRITSTYFQAFAREVDSRLRVECRLVPGMESPVSPAAPSRVWGPATPVKPASGVDPCGDDLCCWEFRFDG